MVCKRMIVRSFGLATFALAAVAGADGTVQFFTDPALFDAAVRQAGKVSKGKWDFAATNSVGPSGVVGFSDPLNINNPGPFDSVPLDNITIQSNLNPQGQGGTNPRGPNGLVLVNAPAFGLDNTAILANTFVDSFDILSGPPAGDNHTALGMDVISLAPSGAPIHVTVFDKQDVEIGKLILPGTDQKQFVGLIMNGGKTIGRVNVYDVNPGNEGAEGVSNLEVYLPDFPDPCPWDLDGNGIVGVGDLLQLFANWGTPGPGDFNNDGTVGVGDMLIMFANWGPCP